MTTYPRYPTDDVLAACDDLLHEARLYDWNPEVEYVSVKRNTVYITLNRWDGLVAKVRVSDHRSRNFKQGPYTTRKGAVRRAFTILTSRPGSLIALIQWIRKHPRPPTWEGREPPRGGVK